MTRELEPILEEIKDLLILSPVVEEIKQLLENGDKISPEVARRLQLALSLETLNKINEINGTVKKVKAAVDENTKIIKDYPSLLWLLRHKTKTTITIIFIIFCLLSALYISGIRVPIMEWLGLPPLLP